ncbi:unnamed protein product, partial [Polarella glacialis]
AWAQRMLSWLQRPAGSAFGETASLQIVSKTFPEMLEALLNLNCGFWHKDGFPEGELFPFLQHQAFVLHGALRLMGIAPRLLGSEDSPEAWLTDVLSAPVEALVYSWEQVDLRAGLRPFGARQRELQPMFAIQDVTTSQLSGCDVDTWAQPQWSGEVPHQVWKTEQGPPLYQKFLSLDDILQSISRAGFHLGPAINLGANDGACRERWDGFRLGAQGLGMLDPLNCLALRGFPTVLVEGDAAHFQALRARFSSMPSVQMVLRLVEVESIVADLKIALGELAEEFRAIPAKPLVDFGVSVLKIDIDTNDCDFLEAILNWTEPLVIHCEISKFTLRVPPDIAVRQRGTDGAQTSFEAGLEPDSGSQIGCSLGAMLEILGPRYRLLQIEAPQGDSVFLRKDVSQLFPFARQHAAGEVWRRYVWCDMFTMLDTWGDRSRLCDHRLFGDPEVPLSVREEFARRCLHHEWRVLRGLSTNFTVSAAVVQQGPNWSARENDSFSQWLEHLSAVIKLYNSRLLGTPNTTTTI